MKLRFEPPPLWLRFATFGLYVAFMVLRTNHLSLGLAAFAAVVALMIGSTRVRGRRSSAPTRAEQELVAREQEEENRRKLIAEANALLEEPLPREVSPLEERLRRGERDVREWVADIRKVGGGENRGFREASIPPDALWSIVDDQDADESARAAAAIMLRDRLGEPGRERLRVSSETIASPRLRVAVSAVADVPEDEELVKSLEVLDD